MKAIQSLTTNILKTMKTLHHFLQMTLSMLLHLFNPPQLPSNKSNTQGNITKQQPTQFPPRIPSLQPPYPPLRASKAPRENSVPSASLQTGRRSGKYLCKLTVTRSVSHLCKPTAERSIKHLCELLRVTHFLSALKNPNQSTGPPLSTRPPFPDPSNPPDTSVP